MKTMLQETIDQIGMEAVQKSMSPTLTIAMCDLHGHYAHTHDAVPCCPLCPKPNGDSATEVEHFINVNSLQNLGTNPHQKLNPTGL